MDQTNLDNAALCVQEEALWKYFDLSAIPMKIVGPNYRLMRYNQAFSQLLGYAHSSLKQPIDIHGLVLDEDIPGVKRAMQEIFAGETMRTQFEARLRHQDGSLVWAQEIVVPRQPLDGDPEREPAFAIVVSIDVTRQKEMEQRIQQTERMRSIGQLAGSVAHDFNNILTVFAFYTEMLRSRLEEHDLKELRFYLDKLQSGIDQGVRLSRQLTEFGSERVRHDEPLDINAYLQNADSLLGHYLNENFKIQLQLEPNAPPVRMSVGVLDQIVLNLAINARDAMPVGGTLRLKTSTEYLSDYDVAAYPSLQSGQFLVLEVRDEGVGIPEEIQAHIFEPFYTTKSAIGGTGLGLSTVYGLMQQLGGAIYVDSKPGSGTTFTLYFPTFSAPRPQPNAGASLENLN